MKKLLLTTAYLFIGSQTFADDSTKYQCGDAIFTIKSNPKSVSLDVSTNGNPVGSLRSFGGEKGSERRAISMSLPLQGNSIGDHRLTITWSPTTDFILSVYQDGKSFECFKLEKVK
jgi:hypothetical protein